MGRVGQRNPIAMPSAMPSTPARRVHSAAERDALKKAGKAGLFRNARSLEPV